MNGGHDSVLVIDIESLQNSLENIAHGHWTPCGTISKITSLNSIGNVRHHNSDLYKEDHQPVAVSIGPYHHGKSSTRAMEKKKWHCLQFLLKANCKVTLNDYLKVVGELYPVARSCYTETSEDIKMESNRFVEMLLLDSCFIIVYLCGLDWSTVDNPNSVPEEPNQGIDPLDFCLATHDLLLMENQIPFFVICRIYELFVSKENMLTAVTPISEKIAIFMEGILVNNPIALNANNRPTNFCHLLHLCHMFFQPSRRNRIPHAMHLSYPYSCHQPKQWHRAVQYDSAGIKFEKREFKKRHPHSLLDVRFGDGVLQIPYLVIDEGTAILFKNLIAFEQTNHDQFGTDFMSYIAFLSQLISDVKDVNFLVSKGIIGHQFGSNEQVLDILADISGRIVFHFDGDYYLKTIHKSLESCYNSRINSWGGWLRHLNGTHGWT